MKTGSSWCALNLSVLLSAVVGCERSSQVDSTSDRDSPQDKVRPSIQFRDVTEEVGIDFVHFNGATGKFYFPEIMGAGGALFDYDNDGDLDVYLLQGNLLGDDVDYHKATSPPQCALPPRNRLYRNELINSNGDLGQLRFVDATEDSGTGDTGYAMGVATGDYDNDGFVDLYITNFGKDVLLRNRGNGTFEDVTGRVGLGDPRWTTSASFFDYDRDGWLDLALVAYCDYALTSAVKCVTVGGSQGYCAPYSFLGVPAKLYRNTGQGRFEDVTQKLGIDLAYGHGLGIATADFDANGWVDMYVSNDGDANQLWLNDSGQFKEAGLMSGIALNQTGRSEAGMGIAIGDPDGDSDWDVFVTHFSDESNTYYQNNGLAVFDDVTDRHKLAQESIGYVSFGVDWIDMDHDADLDLFVVSGDVREHLSADRTPLPFEQTNQVFLNTGNNQFRDATRFAGKALQKAEISRGLATGDIDNDGDVDVLITNNDGPARLLLNELSQREHWLVVRVIDSTRNRDAYGAVVRLTLTNGQVLSRQVQTDGSYCSASDPRMHFAWPTSVDLQSINVTTADGRVMPASQIQGGRFITFEIDGEHIRIAP